MSAFVPGSGVELRSYGGERVRCELAEPADTAELVRLLESATHTGRRVTFRGLGHALDSQSLNTDLVIALNRLGGLRFAQQATSVTAGSGVSSGELARAAAARGSFPAVLVTTSEASIGGTVSHNCVSRFTPVRGHEGDHVESLELVTATGDLLRCSPDQNADVFWGVVGGMGYLGCITSVTLKLDPKVLDQVETTVVTKGSVEQVLDSCTPPFPDGESRYAVLMSPLDHGMAYSARYVSGQKLRRYRPVYEPYSLLRLLGELLMRTDYGNRLTWWLNYRTVQPRYVDPLMDFTFFMDGNARMRHLGWRWGFDMRAIQQSFQLPADKTPEFVALAKRECEKRSFLPSLSDALFCPRTPALMSSSFELDGFLVTLGFEISNQARLEAVKSALVSLSAHCRRLSGRVHFVKSVHASPDDLEAMYAETLPIFADLKRRLDPRGVLRNEFLERTLPRLV